MHMSRLWVPETTIGVRFSRWLVRAVVAIGTIVRGAGPQAIWLLLLPAWLFLRMAFNAVDGMMAREHDLATPLGAILNELGDVLSDVALYLPLAFLHAPSRWPVVAFVLGAVMTEFCGVLAQALGGGRQYQGPMGKSDRAFWIGALALATALRPALFSIWPVFFGVAAALTLPTCGLRLRAALSAVKP